MKRIFSSLCVCCLGFVWVQTGIAQSDGARAKQEQARHLALVRQQETEANAPGFQRPAYGFANRVNPNNKTANFSGQSSNWSQVASPFPRETTSSVFGRQNSPLDSSVAKLKKAESDEEKDAAKEEIAKELEKQYDVFLAQNQKSLDQLRARLEELEKQLEKRKDAKERLIELKLEMLVSQAEGLGWPGESAQPRLNIRSQTSGFGQLNRSVPSSNSARFNEVQIERRPSGGSVPIETRSSSSGR